MKRYQIVLCIAALVTTVVAFWCAYWMHYEHMLGAALFFVFLAIAALAI